MNRISHYILLGALGVILSGCGKDDNEILPGDRISVLNFESELQIDPRLSEEEITLPPAFRNIAWTQAGGFPTHTAYHLELDGLTPLFAAEKVIAKATKDRRITATPLMADRRVFVLGSQLDLTALDAKSGALIWTRSLLPAPKTIARENKKPKYIKPEIEDGWMGGIAYAQGRIFAATGFGEVIAINAQSGAIEWRSQNRVPFSNAPTVRDGRVFVIAQDSALKVFSTDDGKVLWDFLAITEQASIVGASSPAVSDQVVVAGFNSGEVSALRVINGTPNWSDTLSGRAAQITPISELNTIIGRPVIDRDRVFVVSHGGRFAAIDLRTGERAWTADIASIEMPWVMGDYVLVMTTESQIICLSRALGRVRWVSQLPRFRNEKTAKHRIIWTGPIVGGGKILTASSDGRLIALDPQNGSVLNVVHLPKSQDKSAGVSVPPIIADGVLYVVSNAGNLYAFK